MHTLSNLRFKNRTKFISIIALFVGSILFNSFGKDISFFIPEDHVLYYTVDSLHKEMNKTEKEFLQFEIKVIKDQNVRKDKISVKGQYLNFAIENKMTDTASVLTFCELLESLLASKERYFSTLLAALEGDERAMCFNFLKKIKSSIGESSTLGREFHEKTLVQKKPDLNSNKATLQIDENMKIGLEDILNNKDEEFAYSHEMTIEKRDTVEDTTSVLMLSNLESNETTFDIENVNGDDAMISSMASFFDDQIYKEDSNEDIQEPKVN